MEAADLRTLGNREAAGKESADRPAKVAKTLSIEGKRNIAFEFIVGKNHKRITAAIEANGCTIDQYKVIDHGNRVDFVTTANFEQGLCVWRAGGSKSEVKLENGKVVVYTPPCTATFTKKELDELPFKQLRYKLTMEPLKVLGRVLDKAGIPYAGETLLDFEEKFMHTLEGDEDYDEEDDAGDKAEADLGNPEPTVTSEQGTTA